MNAVTALFRRLMPQSVRSRLMLWNMLALAVLLGVFGGFMRYAVVSTMRSSIDRELLMRTEMLANRPPRPEQWGLPGGMRFGPPPFSFNERDDAGGPPEEHGPKEHGQEDRSPEERRPPDQRRLRRPQPPADEPVFRPRRYDLSGKPMGPGPNDAAKPLDPEAFAYAKQGHIVYRNIVINGEPLRLLSRPVSHEGQIEGVIEAPYPLTEINRATRSMDTALLLLIPLALACAGIGSALLTNVMLRPVRSITQTATHIGAENLAERLPVSGNDEFAALSRTFNGMLERLQSAFHRQERLIEQQRRFTADASHELKSPLTVIRGNSALLLGDMGLNENQKESLEDIHRASGEMSRLVQDLLLLARSDSGQLGRDRILLLVSEVMQRAVSNVRGREGAPIRVHCADEALCIEGNESELTRVFTNLLDNAQRATPATGKIEIDALREGKDVLILVRDTGMGIAPEHLPHLGERFYRVDTSRTRSEGGTGLGLSICKSIIEAHAGEISFQSVPGEGTTVSVRLPLAEAISDSPAGP